MRREQPQAGGPAEAEEDPSWGLEVMSLPRMTGDPGTRCCPSFAECLQAPTDVGGHCTGKGSLGRDPDRQFLMVKAGTFRKTG